ncbi:MAG: hypothetical protein ABW220_07545 [Burkholderiaceae bacterium]
MTTTRLHFASATSTTIKALVFGAVTSLAMVFGIAHAQEQRDMRAAIVTLDPVVITIKREQLPTVYITGRRGVATGSEHVASAH